MDCSGTAIRGLGYVIRGFVPAAVPGVGAG